MLPAIGSMITQAICTSLFFKHFFQRGRIIVGNHYGVPGNIRRYAGAIRRPKVANPDPAFTSKPSLWP